MEEKVSLPVKTKIAAWWMIGWGITGIIFGLGTIIYRLLTIPPGEFLKIYHFYFLISFFALVYLFLGFYLLKNKKWAWWGSFIITIISFILLLKRSALIINLIPLIPLILLLLDRKNFWKVAK